MFQGSKRDFYQRQNFSERKSSIPFREMLAFSFLPSNETKSKDKPKWKHLVYEILSLSFSLFKRTSPVSLIPIVKIDSKLLTNGQKSPRGTPSTREVERILAREFFAFDSQIHREDPECRAIEATKKGRNGEINSDPGQNGRLESHYLAITVQNTRSSPLPPHSTMRDVILFLRFNFLRFASILKIFLSFLHFFSISKKKNTSLIFFLDSPFNWSFFRHVNLKSWKKVYVLIHLSFLKKNFVPNLPFFSIHFFFRSRVKLGHNYRSFFSSDLPFNCSSVNLKKLMDKYIHTIHPLYYYYFFIS